MSIGAPIFEIPIDATISSKYGISEIDKYLLLIVLDMLDNGTKEFEIYCQRDNISDEKYLELVNTVESKLYKTLKSYYDDRLNFDYFIEQYYPNPIYKKPIKFLVRIHYKEINNTNDLIQSKLNELEALQCDIEDEDIYNELSNISEDISKLRNTDFSYANSIIDKKMKIVYDIVDEDLIDDDY